MHIDESFVYFKTKQYLSDNGWTILAGEPAGGSDELPRIEIRNPGFRDKGSKGSYKIDLISQKGDVILLTEIKVTYSHSDITKLNDITSTKNAQLIAALKERLDLDISLKKIIKSLSLNNLKSSRIPYDFVCFKVGETIEVINQHLLPKD
ncbi:MAG: hypothetical protein PHH14_00665 [Candidatus Margulisbacteria bacterium]|nr:hypothetical protein [Candidatus Margulisiibacteriota bacterium]